MKQEVVVDEKLQEILRLAKQKKKNRYGGRHKIDSIDGMIMSAPPVIGYLLFSLFPIVLSLMVSFTELHSYYFGDMVWVGLKNYIEILSSEMFWISLKNSLYYSLSVPLNLALGIFLANMLTKNAKGRSIARVILFFPTICSGVAVTLMWQWIYEPNFGVLNTLLSALGLNKVPFTIDARFFMPSVLFMQLWKEGTNIILIQAAFAQVDESLKEAARLDGANERQVFWHVSFKAITPTLFYLLVMNFLTAMQEMSVMQVLTSNGVGPNYAAVTMSYYQYRMSFVAIASQGFGYGCAMGWIIALIIIAITRLQFWLSKKWVSYD